MTTVRSSPPGGGGVEVSANGFVDRDRGTFRDVDGRVFACLLLLPAALAGCGGSSDSGQSDSVASLQRGIKGESADERPSPLHIAAADCARLAAAVHAHLGVELRRVSDPSPPLSQCHLRAPGVDVNVYLDTGHGAPQRYDNRMVEQVQFGAPDRAKLPHPVAGVGEPAAYNHNASWVPAYDTLFALRGPRWLTVAYSRAGVPSSRLLPEAAALARLAFRLTAR
jgi:hypothetical protein